MQELWEEESHHQRSWIKILGLTFFGALYLDVATPAFARLFTSS